MVLQTVESFYVGGKYFETERGTFMAGQAYVQRRSPETLRQPFPIVMLHGGGDSGATFETTPDGRPGWADYFVGAGFAVYLVDRPGNGRSVYLEEAYGELRPPPSVAHSENSVKPEISKLWPNAELHNQFPGSGKVGDPIFDQHYAAAGHGHGRAGVGAMDYQEQINREAGAALLDRIGPAILLTHSQSTLYGWLIGDARPELVKGIVAVEPVGPPFVPLVERVGPPEYYPSGGEVTRPYGLTATPIAYDPPVVDPAVDLPFTLQTEPDGPNLVCCRLQTEPARKLVTFAQFPVAIVTSEASYLSNYEHCMVKYLQQAGVDATHIYLPEVGIHGNGHEMMLEKNSDEIAEFIEGWLAEHGLAK